MTDKQRTIEEWREYYRVLRARYREGSYQYNVYNAMCINTMNARTIAEAREYTRANIDNHAGNFARQIYSDFMQQTARIEDK